MLFVLLSKQLFIFGFAGSSLLHRGFPLVAADRGSSLTAIHRLRTVAPSLVVAHQLADAQAQRLWNTG